MNYSKSSAWSPVLNEHMNRYNRRSAGKPESEMTPEELFNYNMPFAISEANRYASGNLDLGDLIQESLRGLHEASVRFDPKNDNKFITYAVWWCRSFIQDHVASFSADVRIPRNAWVAAQQARSGKGHTAAMLRHNGNTIEEVELARRGFLSLDHEIEGMDGATVGDAVAGDHGKQGEAMDDIALAGDIDRFLSTLSDRHAMVVREYFGLGGKEPRSLDSMRADLGGISRERVRQLREEALDEVRENLGGRYSSLWEHADERLDGGARFVGRTKTWRAKRAKR